MDNFAMGKTSFSSCTELTSHTVRRLQSQIDVSRALSYFCEAFRCRVCRVQDVHRVPAAHVAPQASSVCVGGCACRHYTAGWLACVLKT